MNSQYPKELETIIKEINEIKHDNWVYFIEHKNNPKYVKINGILFPIPNILKSPSGERYVIYSDDYETLKKVIKLVNKKNEECRTKNSKIDYSEIKTIAYDELVLLTKYLINEYKSDNLIGMFNAATEKITVLKGKNNE